MINFGKVILDSQGIKIQFESESLGRNSMRHSKNIVT